MIGLEERVEQDLDVAGDLETRALDVADAIELQVLQVRGNRRQRLQQRLGLRILVDEHEISEPLAAHPIQAEAGRVRVREVALLAHGKQPAGQIVGAAVITAEEPFGLALLALDERRAGLLLQSEAAGSRQFVHVQRVQS